MAPQTRSQSMRSKRAPIAGFPGASQPAGASRKARPLAPEYELRATGTREPESFDPFPPVYTIDLSRPPAERYTEVVADFKPLLTDLPTIFDELVTGAGYHLKRTRLLARLLMRRVHSKEQTEELRGISRTSGVDMYLLVCFNTLLDLFMGCTSGGARVETESGTSMYHFRTLDWEMDRLRRVVVQLQFVERPHGPITARTVTYVGYVGVLTGVRERLSMSLNFRPYHNNDSSRAANFKFLSHQIAVLLGFKPSVSSILRDMLIPRVQRSSGQFRITEAGLPTLQSIKRTLPSMPSTAAYLIFSDGDETVVFEKDRRTAVQRSSNSFIAVTNCDVSPGQHDTSPRIDLISDLLEEASDRHMLVEREWNGIERRFRRRIGSVPRDDVSARPQEIVRLLQTYPTTNESTHYSVIMDPKSGNVVWAKRFLEGEVEGARRDELARGERAVRKRR